MYRSITGRTSQFRSSSAIPTAQEYAYDAGGMGGANATQKPFSLFPAERYKGTNPEKILALDGKQYGTEYRYENGVIAWIATADTVLSP